MTKCYIFSSFQKTAAVPLTPLRLPCVGGGHLRCARASTAHRRPRTTSARRGGQHYRYAAHSCRHLATTMLGVSSRSIKHLPGLQSMFLNSWNKCCESCTCCCCSCSCSFSFCSSRCRKINDMSALKTYDQRLVSNLLQVCCLALLPTRLVSCRSPHSALAPTSRGCSNDIRLEASCCCPSRESIWVCSSGGTHAAAGLRSCCWRGERGQQVRRS